MKKLAAIGICTALIAPGTSLLTISQAEARTSGTTIKNCSKTQHGTTVRIRLRDNGDFTRVRLSHPDGTGIFENHKVRKVIGSAGVASFGPPHRLRATFRIGSVDLGAYPTVIATFKLRNGHHINLRCSTH